MQVIAQQTNGTGIRVYAVGYFSLCTEKWVSEKLQNSKQTQKIAMY